MNCTIEQFEDVVAKFKYFAESVNIELSSEAEGLRQELVARRAAGDGPGRNSGGC